MYVKSLHSVKMYCILLVVCFIIYSSSTSTGTTLNSGTCVNPTTLSFIEKSLSNISDQLNEISRETPFLNATITDTNIRLSDIEQRQQKVSSAISSLQSQVSSLSSDVKKISQLLSRHVNITVDDEEETPSSPLLSSCEAILSKWPNSPSGYYSLFDVNGHTCHVYCHMETLCGKGGGWRRIASLNMTDPNEKCPTQFRTYSQDGVRACGRPATSSGSCNILIKKCKVF